MILVFTPLRLGKDVLYINTSGLVGIGTTNPQATLDVSGYMRLAKSSSAPADVQQHQRRCHSLDRRLYLVRLQGRVQRVV